jgi:signal transduction histidine kinase
MFNKLGFGRSAVIDVASKVKILNVDDNAISLYTKSRILRRAGYEVQEASTGGEALRIAMAERPDLALVDVGLPDINGLEVCRRIKADPHLASTLIVQISASHVESIDKARGLEGGADSYLTEPVEPDELVASVKALLRLREAEEKLRQANEALTEEMARRAALAEDNARLYQQTQALNAELEQRVLERTAELDNSLKELDQFIYAVSHDFKSPLRGIDQLARWVNEDAGEVLSESSKGHLAKIRSRVKRMDSLLNDLLTYSRLSRHYYNKGKEPVDTGSLVKEIIHLVAPAPGFVIIVQENMPTLMTYRVLLELVFKNLIDNALKHHHQAEGQIRVSAHEGDDFIEFSVADDGPGIDPAFHNRIFQVFQVLQPRDQVEGSGMGLPIVKRAVESQGGTITVVSTEGQGATFKFTWPKK